MVECALWQGTYLRGYGVVGRGGKMYRAHRVAWEEVHGPIPDGVQVLHACDNKGCVRVEHLFLGTVQDNMDDMVVKGRQARGERNAAARLNEDAVRHIRSRTISTRAAARKYGVSLTTVKRVLSGRNWSHVG